jgi:excisionase family DNA binding protein
VEEEIEKATYSVREAAKRLGIGRDKAYEAIRAGTIPSIKFGKRVKVPKAALGKLLGE